MKLGTALVYVFGIVALTDALTMDVFKGTARHFTIRPKAEKSLWDDSGEKFNTKRDTRATDGFLEELEYFITLEGNTETELHLVRDRAHVLPEGFQQDLSGRFSRKPNTNEQNVAFYKDLNGHGLFACKEQKSTLGEFECGLSALLDIGDETCFIGLGASHADCSAKDDGPPAYLSEIIDDITLRNEAVRNKRSILPAEGLKIVEVAYLPDAKFTDLFYRRHPGDTATAETEMRIFCTLLTNGINVFFSTLKETSNGALDIQVYPTAVALPGFGKNFFWSETNNDGTNLYATDALKSNIEYIINDSDFISERFDYVYAITGFKLRDTANSNGRNIISVTYRRTICTNSRRKYAVTEFTSWNLPRLLAHMLGHALGAEHDAENNHCNDGVNLMASNLFPPDSTTKTTYHYFSVCSVAYIIAHLNRYAPCIADDSTTYEEFVESFCQGLLGEQALSVDKQCQRLTNYTGSTACDSVTEEACYARNLIRCRDSNGQCTHSLLFLWAGTPCDNDKVCFKGHCVDSFQICPTSSTSSTTSTTTTSIPTTTTSSSTTSTTPTTTTTTTTPSTTTSTTSTTSTTTPTTTTSTTTPSTTTSTTSTTSTTTPTTTTSTTSSTTSTTSTPSTTSTTTMSTTSTTSTPTTTAPVPCSCCGFKRDKRRKRCCKKGKKKISAICYCCGPLKDVEEPHGWTGRRF